MPRPAHPLAAALAAFLAAFVLYLLTLCPTVYVAGTGENATAAATLGVPHPPGFPLFCLLGRRVIAIQGASASGERLAALAGRWPPRSSPGSSPAWPAGARRAAAGLSSPFRTVWSQR
jgi:hypothetical protein